MTTPRGPTVLRVCWRGEAPAPGDVLLSPKGKVGYRIRQVFVLHHAHASPKPRLALSVERVGHADASAATRTHPWSITDRPNAAPKVSKPVKVAGPPLPTSEQAAAVAKQRRIDAEAAPPAHADASAWDDPEDKVNTRTPKRVRGYRRGDVLGRMSRAGADVTQDHIIAANLFRMDWDIAMFGLSSGVFVAERVGGSTTPSTTPNAGAHERVRCQREVARVKRVLGDAAWPLLLWVTVNNRDIAAWCRTQVPAPEKSNRRLDPKKEMGKLLAILTRLAEFYGVDSARDRAKQAVAEAARP